MTEYTPTTENILNCYVYSSEGYDGSLQIPERQSRAEFGRWLNEIRAEAWDRAWREIRMIPHWWNTDDQYGEFDMQPLGPDETSEQGAFMAVREVMLDNPYRPNEK